MISERSDAELIHAAQSGDADAFGALYERHLADVYRFVAWKVQHRETAEDITSRAFLNAFDHIGSVSADDTSFRPWIFTIARNAVVDYFRTARSHADIADAWDIAAPDDIARDAEARMLLEKVRKLVAGMDAVQRDVVLLRVWHDLPYAEISRIVGKTPEHCKVIFSRVAKSLRTELAVLLLGMVGRWFL